MKLSTSLVAVRKISSPINRSSFADDELEQAARLILEAEGVINPIVIRRISLESYEVVDGDFEYYAAARAREINPRKGEMIGAFIIDDENEEFIKEQVEVFRSGLVNKKKPEAEKITQETGKKYHEELEQFAEGLTKIKEIAIKQTTTQNNLENLNFKVEQIALSLKRVESILNKPKQLTNEQVIRNHKPQLKYDEMTVFQLKAEAKERKIKGYSKMKRNDLIAALKSNPVNRYPA